MLFLLFCKYKQGLSQFFMLFHDLYWFLCRFRVLWWSHDPGSPRFTCVSRLFTLPTKTVKFKEKFKLSYSRVLTLSSTTVNRYGIVSHRRFPESSTRGCGSIHLTLSNYSNDIRLQSAITRSGIDFVIARMNTKKNDQSQASSLVSNYCHSACLRAPLAMAFTHLIQLWCQAARSKCGFSASKTVRPAGVGGILGTNAGRSAFQKLFFFAGTNSHSDCSVWCVITQ